MRLEDATEAAPLLPEEMCEHEAERHTWRAAVLAFIRDHIDAGETYRLGATDLEYAELLPEKPGSVEQDEYEEQTRVGVNLERLVKSVDSFAGLTNALARHGESDRDEFALRSDARVADTDECRTTRIDIEGGPEIMKVERK